MIWTFRKNIYQCRRFEPCLNLVSDRQPNVVPHPLEGEIQPFCRLARHRAPETVTVNGGTAGGIIALGRRQLHSDSVRNDKPADGVSRLTLASDMVSFRRGGRGGGFSWSSPSWCRVPQDADWASAGGEEEVGRGWGRQRRGGREGGRRERTSTSCCLNPPIPKTLGKRRQSTHWHVGDGLKKRRSCNLERQRTDEVLDTAWAEADTGN